MSDSLDRWFAQEVLVHEDSLMRFLSRSWPNRDEHADIRQETYVRIYEAAAKMVPHAPKAFLFATAKHLMIDRVRRRRVVSIESIGGLGELEELHVLIDEPSSETRAGARQELRHLAIRFDALPPRCRDVLWLRRVEELPQKEVARRLGISDKAVEKALARALRLLTTNVGRRTRDPNGGGIDHEMNYESDTSHSKRQHD
jgi:RNA polymerase sigma factor (sigma-70 family)